MIKRFLNSLIFLFIGLSAFADHFAGADLTYKCVGGNDYIVTLSFYRDCSGIPAPTIANISFKCSSNTGFNFTSTFSLLPGSGVEVTPGCSAVPTRCSGSAYTNYGVQEYVFQGQVTLAPCNSWLISYEGGNRNNITTVTNNSMNNWYIPAMLNNLQAPCNSSPSFSNKPIGIVCNNQQSCFNHGAIDLNGDSLVYSFYSPYTTSSLSTVTYNGSFSYTNFLQSATPITINPLTGDICYFPTMSLLTITGIKVLEYRKINGNYVLIGTVYRDLQLNVDNCIDSIPTLSGMDTLNTHKYHTNDTTYWLETCYFPGKIISFDINGFDADVYDSTNTGSPERFSITWNHGIPQGNFQAHYNYTDSAYGHFNWALQTSDISNLPKCFTATVRDQACPYYGSQTFSYCITVRGMEVSIGTDSLLCTGESLTYTAIADTTTVNYKWTVNGSTIAIPPSQNYYTFNSTGKTPGIYTIGIETNDGGITTLCPGKDNAIVTVVYQPNIAGTLADLTFCKPGSVVYDAGQGAIYQWLDSTFNPIGNSQTHTFNQSGRFLVLVDGGNNTRCTDDETFEIYAIDKPKLPDDTCIWSIDLPYELIVQNPDNVLEYEWNTGGIGDTLDITSSGKYTISAFHPAMNSNLKCSDDAIVNVIDFDNFIKSTRIQADNNPLPDEIDSTGDRIICNHQKLKIVGPLAPNNHSYDYNWTKNGIPVSNSSFYIFNEKVIGEYTIQLEIYRGCVDDIVVTTQSCDVKPPNVITPNGDVFNDFFVIKGLENYPNSSLIIYNRWGKIVFETKNYKNEWNGEDAADGVYYWVLKVADDFETEYKGTLTIIR